jgi:hypothetical protein
MRCTLEKATTDSDSCRSRAKLNRANFPLKSKAKNLTDWQSDLDRQKKYFAHKNQRVTMHRENRMDDGA